MGEHTAAAYRAATRVTSDVEGAEAIPDRCSRSIVAAIDGSSHALKLRQERSLYRLVEKPKVAERGHGGSEKRADQKAVR